jgi:hypothetical protein
MNPDRLSEIIAARPFKPLERVERRDGYALQSGGADLICSCFSLTMG